MTVADLGQSHGVGPSTLQSIQLGVVIVLITLATGEVKFVDANLWIGVAGFGAPLWQWAATTAIAVSSAVLLVKISSEATEPARSWS